MTRIAIVILLTLMGCGEYAPKVDHSALGMGAELYTVDHGPYRCVIYTGVYKGGLWCERRVEGKP